MMRTQATKTWDRAHSTMRVRAQSKTGNRTRPILDQNTTSSQTHSQSQPTQPETSITSQESHEETYPYDPTDRANSVHLLQTSLTTIKDNYPFGDLISSPKQKGTVRIFFQNVNSIFKFRRWDTLKECSSHMKSMEIDIAEFSETNLKWTFRTTNQAKNVLQQTCKIVQVTTSSNVEPSRTSYQPGGTMTVAMTKYTGRIINIIKDDTLMGRWSGFTLSNNFQHNLNIVTVYQSVPSDGIHSTFRQQQSRLLDIGYQNPNPQRQLLDDLQVQVQSWNSRGDITLILIDANDNIYTKDSFLPTFLAKTNLTSLIPNSFDHPPTYARGSKCIDYIFGTTSLLQHVVAGGINAFYEPPYIHSDHRGLFVDLNELDIFGATLNTIIPPTPRKLISTSKRLVKKFMETLESTKQIPSLREKLQTLATTTEWTHLHHEQFE
jgi:hypothetical protein